MSGQRPSMIYGRLLVAAIAIMVIIKATGH
jgi:hypothetical protein